MHVGCAICGGELLDRRGTRRAVCQACDSRAADANGLPARGMDVNPVYVGQHRCWRLGNGEAAYDPWDAGSLGDYLDLFDGRLPRETIASFVQLLDEPPAAIMLGLDADEVAHNRAIDRVVNSSAGAAFVRALTQRIVAVAGSPAPERVTCWSSILSAGALDVRGAFQKSPQVGQRTDEILEVTAGGARIDVIVELKVEAAEDVDQLKGYIEARRSTPGAAPTVLGVLVVLGERPAEVNGDGLAFLGAVDLIAALAQAVDARTPALLRLAINDYRRAVTFLALRDELILRHGLGYRPIGARRVQVWASENWRWIHERLAREVARRMVGQGRAAARVYADPNGSAIDIDLIPSPALPQVHCFAKWRLGKGFELHVGAWGQADARRLIDDARQRLRPATEPHLASYGRLEFSNRRGQSGMVVRVPSAALDANTVSERFAVLAEAVERAISAMTA